MMGHGDDMDQRGAKPKMRSTSAMVLQMQQNNLVPSSLNFNQKQRVSKLQKCTSGREGMVSIDQTLMWQQSNYMSPQESGFISGTSTQAPSIRGTTHLSQRGFITNPKILAKMLMSEDLVVASKH
jgi:hypothetical protein